LSINHARCFVGVSGDEDHLQSAPLLHCHVRNGNAMRLRLPQLNIGNEQLEATPAVEQVQCFHWIASIDDQITGTLERRCEKTTESVIVVEDEDRYSVFSRHDCSSALRQSSYRRKEKDAAKRRLNKGKNPAFEPTPRRTKSSQKGNISRSLTDTFEPPIVSGGFWLRHATNPTGKNT
jgi:hypothetical protein